MKNNLRVENAELVLFRLKTFLRNMLPYACEMVLKRAEK